MKSPTQSSPPIRICSVVSVLEVVSFLRLVEHAAHTSNQISISPKRRLSHVWPQISTVPVFQLMSVSFDVTVNMEKNLASSGTTSKSVCRDRSWTCHVTSTCSGYLSQPPKTRKCIGPGAKRLVVYRKLKYVSIFLIMFQISGTYRSMQVFGIRTLLSPCPELPQCQILES